MELKFEGLSESEAQVLLSKYGYNEIPKEKESLLKSIFKRVFNPLTLMIEAALVLSLILGRVHDAIIIAVLLATNIIIDSYQESKAKKALKALEDKLELTATVLRDGKIKEIPAKYLVPGDIVKLSVGDIVPADVEVVDTEFLELDESAITGESLNKEKNVGDTVYASSIVKSGSAFVRVVKTGLNTQIGKTSTLARKATEGQKSHFEEVMFKISKFLIVLASVLAILVFLYLVFVKGDNIWSVLHFTLVLIVASIPVALPAVLSLLLAIGAHEMAKESSVVKNARALEEIARVDILATDKTGTLTKNSLSIKNPKVFNGYDLDDLFAFAIFASEDHDKNELEQAIEHYAKDIGALDKVEFFEEEKFIPFKPENKRTESFIRSKNGEKFHIMMGAPQVLANFLNNKDKYVLQEEVANLAKEGFRTMATIVSKGEGFELVGVLPFFDPPREDAKDAVSKIKKLGVIVKMITGDNKFIAKMMAKLLGIAQSVVSAEELRKLDDKEYEKIVEKENAFAEVLPEDKYRFIEVLQKNDHAVAMTGDGVNDAPALAKADVGIAVSGATEAARQAADIILTSPGLSVIYKAIKNARATFRKMYSYALFRISETIRVIFFVTLSVLVFNQEPVTAVMIVILALLNDIPVLAITYDNVEVPENPTSWRLKETLIVASVLGSIGVMSSFILLWVSLKVFALSWAVVQTLVFVKLDVAGHSTLYTTRTAEKHFWQKPYPSLKFFIPAFSTRLLGSAAAYFGFMMQPVSLKAIAVIWIYATFWFLLADFVKVEIFRILNKNS